MARSFWVATCEFGWGVGCTEEQAVGEMCRGFRELPEEDLDVWLFKVKDYSEVGPGSIVSESLEERVCFRGVPASQLAMVRDQWYDLGAAVDGALAEADREGQEVGA